MHVDVNWRELAIIMGC